jgi:hypothetical protein
MTLDEARLQRDVAASGMILLAGITLAVFASVFSDRDGTAIEDARRSIGVHEQLLRQASDSQKQNQDDLTAIRASLDKLRAAH